jgi:hypothetical protein
VGVGRDGEAKALVVWISMPGGKLGAVDPLRRDDIERARATPPEERARQTLEAMRTGIRLKRASLVARYPSKAPEEIDDLLQQWLDRDD